jgi:hypothetical protein
LGFHVAVDDAVGVKVVERAHQLDGNRPHALLAQLAVVFKHFVQFAVRELGDQDESLLRFKGVEQGDNVLVAQRLQNCDLRPQARQVPARLSGLGYELEGDHLARMLAPALVDLRN